MSAGWNHQVSVAQHEDVTGPEREAMMRGAPGAVCRALRLGRHAEPGGAQRVSCRGPARPQHQATAESAGPNHGSIRSTMVIAPGHAKEASNLPMGCRSTYGTQRARRSVGLCGQVGANRAEPGIIRQSGLGTVPNGRLSCTSRNSRLLWPREIGRGGTRAGRIRDRPAFQSSLAYAPP